MPVCVTCGETRGFLELRDGVCRSCRDQELERDKNREAEVQLEHLKANRTADVAEDVLDQAAQVVILTTGFDIPRAEIDRICGIVAAEAAISTHIFKDMANELRDAFGGRSVTVQDTLRKARETCFAELKREAYRLDADAVIAVRLNYTEASTRGTGGGILVVAATGTAVKLAV